MSTVYMVDARARDSKHGFMAKLEMILDAAALDGLCSPGQQLLIKAPIGELGNTGYLRPVVIRALVEKLLALGNKPLIADGRGLDARWPTGLDWFEVAKMHGFTSGTLGAEITLADSYTGAEGEDMPTGCKQLSMVKVARLVKESKAMLVVSHVTGHPLTGLSGAISTLGLGCLARQGKAKVHRVLKLRVASEKCDGCGACLPCCPSNALVARDEDLIVEEDSCDGCAACLVSCPLGAITMEPESVVRFQERVAEAAKAVVKTLDGKIRFLNFLMDVGPHPDGHPFSDSPFVPNLGILMSDDPVAIDQASLDLINRSPGIPQSAAEEGGVLDPGVDKLAAIVGVDPTPMIGHAEELALGHASYRLMISS